MAALVLAGVWCATTTTRTFVTRADAAVAVIGAAVRTAAPPRNVRIESSPAQHTRRDFRARPGTGTPRTSHAREVSMPDGRVGAPTAGRKPRSVRPAPQPPGHRVQQPQPTRSRTAPRPPPARSEAAAG